MRPFMIGMFLGFGGVAVGFVLTRLLFWAVLGV